METCKLLQRVALEGVELLLAPVDLQCQLVVEQVIKVLQVQQDDSRTSSTTSSLNVS